MEISHGELQKYHNEALKNPDYRIEGLLEARMEEMDDYRWPALEGRETQIATPQEEPWSISQWDIVNQLRLGFAYLNRRFSILEKKVQEREGW